MKHLVTAASILLITLTVFNAEARKHKKKKHPKKPAVSSVTGAVDMNFALEVNGALIMHPHVALALNEKGTLTQKMGSSLYTIEVTPTAPVAGQIKTEFAISQTVNGATTRLSNPRIVSLNGERARMEQKGDDGHSFALDVTAKM